MEGEAALELASAAYIPRRRRSSDIEYIGVWLSSRDDSISLPGRLAPGHGRGPSRLGAPTKASSCPLGD